MTTTKTPTQRGISTLLARHFERSKSTASRIRGWRNHSDGYAVQGAYEGVVWVRHEVISFRPLPGDEKRIAAMLAEYATAIEAAGFAVERQRDRLVVTAKTEA
jgi:hypothetical protein